MEVLGLLFFVAATASVISMLCSLIGLAVLGPARPQRPFPRAFFFGAWASFLILFIAAVAPVLMFGFEEGADIYDVVLITPPALLLFPLTRRYARERGPGPSAAPQA